ncbi:MAG TPA: hypothetical protein VHX38_04515 [Pseudonocardiaceae bacterium]|nr:hypothetical protein [Pseudonocardiaceae bacterium]
MTVKPDTHVAVTVKLSAAEAKALAECAFTCTSAERWSTAGNALAKVKKASRQAQERCS